MSVLITPAAEGRPAAMKELYKINKKKVWAVSFLLAGNRKDAEAALRTGFYRVWGEVQTWKITTDELFTNRAVRKAAEYIRDKASKADSKVFKSLPEEILKEDLPGNYDEDYPEALKKLPLMTRFAYVLKLAGFTDDQIQSFFRLNKEETAKLTGSVETLTDAVLNAAGSNQTYEAFGAELENLFETMTPSDEADKKVYEDIEKIAAPFEAGRKRNRAIGLAAAGAVLIFAVLIAGITYYKKVTAEPTGTVETVKELKYSLDEDKTYYADITVKDYGVITVQLDQEAAPLTAANFVKNAEKGLYDGLTFHRIIEGFMMQGGDSEEDWGYTIKGEFSENGVENDLSHTRGAISMARTDDNDSAWDQFFIVQADSTSLDGSYAVFGYVTEGMEIVDEICEDAEPTDDNGTIEDDAQPVIESIVIRTE